MDYLTFAAALSRLQAYEMTGNPKFLEAKVEQTPCRVSADLRIEQHKEDQYIAPDFNPWEDGHVEAVVSSPELRKPLQDLLLALEQIEMAERSFGVDKAKALDSLIGPLKDMRDAFIVLFRCV